MSPPLAGLISGVPPLLSPARVHIQHGPRGIFLSANLSMSLSRCRPTTAPHRRQGAVQICRMASPPGTGVLLLGPPLFCPATLSLFPLQDPLCSFPASSSAAFSAQNTFVMNSLNTGLSAGSSLTSPRGSRSIPPCLPPPQAHSSLHALCGWGDVGGWRGSVSGSFSLLW